MNAAVKVGLFAAAALLIGAWLVIRIEELPFFTEKPAIYYVVLPNAQGLEKKAPVRMSGVKVGTVRDISLKNTQVRATLELEKNVHIPKGTFAVVESLGFLGEKHLELHVAPNETEWLPEKTEILGKTGADWNETIQWANDIGSDVKSVTENLRKVLGEEKGEMRLETIVTRLAEITERLSFVVAQNQDSLHRTVKNVEDITSVLKETSLRVDSVVKKVDEGQGSLGQWIQSPETSERVNHSLETVQKGVDSINNVLRRVVDTQVRLGLRTEYSPAPNWGKGYATLDLIPPSSSRFYRLEIATQPLGVREWSTTTTTNNTLNGFNNVSLEKKETLKSGWGISAMVGQRLGPMVLRAGLFESTGGAGVDVLLLQDRLRLTSEAWNFTRGGPLPHAKIHAAFYPWKNIFLSAGWDDFLNRSRQLDSIFLGAGLFWDAEDIKYILPSVPVP